MIPQNIKREHIIKAIEEYENNKNTLCKGRKSRKYFLVYNEKMYPPKCIVSLASKYANGTELKPSEFGGGKETNNFLRSLSFDIEEISSEKPSKPNKNGKYKIKDEKGQNKRTKGCKEIIHGLLVKSYGEVEEGYGLEVGTSPEDYKDAPYYDALKKIYESLQNYRGNKDFVKSDVLAGCDYFVPDPGFILEFDESQHFTLARKTALENYPEDLKLGFSREKWIQLCDKLKSADNDPPYRDEQRAWYDTLRDFLPLIKGLKPTVRIYEKDCLLCSLDPEDARDRGMFKHMLENSAKDFKLSINNYNDIDENPDIARLIIADEWIGDIYEAREMLMKLVEMLDKELPDGKRAKFIMTPGGFIQFEWPHNITDIGDSWDPDPEIVNQLVDEAKKWAEIVLKGLTDQLYRFADYITLGIDSCKKEISTTYKYISKPHIELVFLVDLKNNKYMWSGKSYPTPGQQRGLVRIKDLNKHFFDLPGVGKVMILGCHDLNIFNGRSENAKGKRKEVRNKFLQLALNEKPKIVLHHPHTSCKERTWLNAWVGLNNCIKGIKAYAGSGRFYDPDCEPWKENPDRNKVLERTKKGYVIDILAEKL